MQQPCRYNTIPYLVNNLPFSSGKAFFPRGIQTGAHPQFTSKQPSKNMESPFGPQRHSWSMLQLYRKGSDMTARVITPPLEGTSNFVGYGKIWTSDGGGRGVPGTLKGQCPDISSPFSEKSLFFCQRGEKPPKRVGNSSDSCNCCKVFNMFFYSCAFYSTLVCHVCFQCASSPHKILIPMLDISLKNLLTDYWWIFNAHVANTCGENNHFCIWTQVKWLLLFNIFIY